MLAIAISALNQVGIGAYQAREYVMQLGGVVDVTSTVGEGTRFDIWLPVAS